MLEMVYLVAIFKDKCVSFGVVLLFSATCHRLREASTSPDEGLWMRI